MIPKYYFSLCDAPKHGEAKRFADTLIATGRFWRNERGLLRFKVGPGDYLTIESRHALREILLSGEVVEMAGDDMDADLAWLWFTSRKFSFPRLDPEKPWNPPAPKPVSRVGHEYVSARRVRS